MNLKTINILFVLLSLSFFLAACGDGAWKETVTARATGVTFATQTSLWLKAFDGQTMAFDRSSEDSNVLTQVNRVLPHIGFDVLVEPRLTDNSVEALSIITGMVIQAVNLDGEPLKVTLGIIARKFDEESGSLSLNTKIFAPQGTDFTKTQQFYISNDDTPNNVLTGMGLHLRDARVSKISLQRKGLGSLYEKPRDIKVDEDSKGARVVLDAGWVATGFFIRVSPNESEDKFPFVQDIILYTAQLTES